MNDNPWNVDNMARAERERIQEEMRQIRLEQAAERAQVRVPRLPWLIRVLIQWWADAREKRPAPKPQPRTVHHTARPKPHVHA